MTNTQKFAEWWNTLGIAHRFGFSSVVVLVLAYLTLFILFPANMLATTIVLVVIASIIGTACFFIMPPWNR